MRTPYPEDYMNRDGYKSLLWMMWVALPATALNYWRAWDQLPTRMAVHFDMNWRPNGYTSREGALMLALSIMTFMLFVFTIVGQIVIWQKPGTAWPMLVVFYLSLGILWFANNWIVVRNLNPQPLHSELVGPISPAMSDSDSRRNFQLHL